MNKPASEPPLNIRPRTTRTTQEEGEEGNEGEEGPAIPVGIPSIPSIPSESPPCADEPHEPHEPYETHETHIILRSHCKRRPGTPLSRNFSKDDDGKMEVMEVCNSETTVKTTGAGVNKVKKVENGGADLEQVEGPVEGHIGCQVEGHMAAMAGLRQCSMPHARGSRDATNCSHGGLRGFFADRKREAANSGNCGNSGNGFEGMIIGPGTHSTHESMMAMATMTTIASEITLDSVFQRDGRAGNKPHNSRERSRSKKNATWDLNPREERSWIPFPPRKSALKTNYAANSASRGEEMENRFESDDESSSIEIMQTKEILQQISKLEDTLDELDESYDESNPMLKAVHYMRDKSQEHLEEPQLTHSTHEDHEAHGAQEAEEAQEVQEVPPRSNSKGSKGSVITHTTHGSVVGVGSIGSVGSVGSVAIDPQEFIQLKLQIAELQSELQIEQSRRQKFESLFAGVKARNVVLEEENARLQRGGNTGKTILLEEQLNHAWGERRQDLERMERMQSRMEFLEKENARLGKVLQAVRDSKLDSELWECTDNQIDDIDRMPRSMRNSNQRHIRQSGLSRSFAMGERGDRRWSLGALGVFGVQDGDLEYDIDRLGGSMGIQAGTAGTTSSRRGSHGAEMDLLKKASETHSTHSRWSSVRSSFQGPLGGSFSDTIKEPFRSDNVEQFHGNVVLYQSPVSVKNPPSVNGGGAMGTSPRVSPSTSKTTNGSGISNIDHLQINEIVKLPLPNDCNPPLQNTPKSMVQRLRRNLSSSLTTLTNSMTSLDTTSALDVHYLFDEPNSPNKPDSNANTATMNNDVHKYDNSESSDNEACAHEMTKMTNDDRCMRRSGSDRRNFLRASAPPAIEKMRLGNLLGEDAYR